jgi:hypothetical protein
MKPHSLLLLLLESWVCNMLARTGSFVHFSRIVHLCPFALMDALLVCLASISLEVCFIARDRWV